MPHQGRASAACLDFPTPDVLTIELPDDTTGLPQVLAKPVGAGPQAWGCRGPQCLAPLADIESLLACLKRDGSDA